MDIHKIAMKVAGLRQIQLHGPFVKSDNPSEFYVEMSGLNFGISGQFADILEMDTGLDKKEIEIGPQNHIIEVGYDVISEDYTPGHKSLNRDYPDDPVQYELLIKITSLDRYKLSDDDSNLLARIGLEDQVLNKVYDKHFQNMSSDDNYDF